MVVQKGSSKLAQKSSAASSKTALKSRAKVDLKPVPAKAKVTKTGTAAKRVAEPGKASTLTHGSKVASVVTKNAPHKATGAKATAIYTQKSKTNSPMISNAPLNTASKTAHITTTSKAQVSSKVITRRSGSSHRGLGELGSETVCREVACEGLATSGGYCRLHYIKNWKKIKRKESILREKRLNQYIEELVVKYPDKYIEAIRQDLANDKDFAKVIYDLDLDEGVDDFDVEGGDSVDSLIDNIKRDFDDEGDGF